MKISEQIAKEINESDNPLKTAIDNGCQLSMRQPTDYEKKHRIVTYNFVLPVAIKKIDIKFNFDFDRD